MADSTCDLMHEATIALLALHCTFAVTFTAGFALPLAIAGAEERASRSENIRKQRPLSYVLGPLLDVWLLLEDSIPVFWLFRLIADGPDDVRAAKRKWKEESTIRLCFWIALGLLLTLPLYLAARA